MSLVRRHVGASVSAVVEHVVRGDGPAVDAARAHALTIRGASSTVRDYASWAHNDINNRGQLNAPVGGVGELHHVVAQLRLKVITKDTAAEALARCGGDAATVVAAGGWYDQPAGRGNGIERWDSCAKQLNNFTM
eukprot:gene43153-49814_t